MTFVPDSELSLVVMNEEMYYFSWVYYPYQVQGVNDFFNLDNAANVIIIGLKWGKSQATGIVLVLSQFE